MTIEIESRYQAAFALHALGDTIGFRNGIWEFNYGTTDFYMEDLMRIFYDFIALGGVNHLKMEGWKVSDDTLLNLATADSFLQSREITVKNVTKNFVKNLIKESKDMEGRYPGRTTMASIDKLEKGEDWRNFEYNENSGGSGSSMRCMSIGLVFHKEDQLEDLIKFSIECSRVTHNSTIGYLGGMVSALFTSFAIRDVKLYDWPYKLVEILESDIIDNIIKSTRGYDEYERDKHSFIGKWKQYIEDKFVDGLPKQPISDLVQRSKYYHNTFRNKSKGSFIGSGGDDSVIIAYDCLVDCTANWEKLIVYAMLHIGDTDTTGSIAAGWYGAFFDFFDVPDYMVDSLEYRDRILQTGKEMYKRFYKN